jgi:hypothetical protein
MEQRAFLHSTTTIGGSERVERGEQSVAWTHERDGGSKRATTASE